MSIYTRTAAQSLAIDQQQAAGYGITKEAPSRRLALLRHESVSCSQATGSQAGSHEKEHLN